MAGQRRSRGATSKGRLFARFAGRRVGPPVALLASAAMLLSLTAVVNDPTAKAGASKVKLTSAPSALEAFRAAKKQKSPVEILSERTDSTTTYALPSGKRQIDFGDVSRIEREGHWYDFDANLVPTRGNVDLPVVDLGQGLPRLAQRPGSLRSVKVPSAALLANLAEGQRMDAKLASTLAAERHARLLAGSRFGKAGVLSPRVSMVPIRISRGGTTGSASPAAVGAASPANDDGSTPLGEIETTKGASIALYWPDDLPQADVQGRDASYDLPGPQELHVTAEDRGFNAHVELQQRPDLTNGAPVYRFPIQVDGVRLVRTEDGGYAALDEKGRAVFRIAPTVAWDSTPLAVDQDEPTTTLVDSDLVTDDTGQTVLEVRPSVDFLANAQCPCFIDPNISYTAAPVYDTMVREATPTTSFGSSSLVQSGKKDSTTERQRGYIQFNTGLIANTVVSSATLQLRQNDATTCTASAVDINPVAGPWDESTTWNTHPNYVSNLTYQVQRSFNHGFTGCAAAYESFNVTPIVAAWTAGSLIDYGFNVRGDTDDDARRISPGVLSEIPHPVRRSG